MILWLVTRNAFRNVLIGFVVVSACSAATTVFAAVRTSATYNVSGNTRISYADINFPSPQSVVGGVEDSDGKSSNVGKPVFVETTIDNQIAAAGGSSDGGAYVAAGAAIGQFKLEASGAVEINYVGLPYRANTVESSTGGGVEASWSDTIRFEGSNTSKAILHGKFLVDGSLLAQATDSPDSPYGFQTNPFPQRNWAAAQGLFTLWMTAGRQDPLGPYPVNIPNHGTGYAAVGETTNPLAPQYDHPVPQSIPYDIVVTPYVTYPLEVTAIMSFTARATNDAYVHLVSGKFSSFFSGELGNTISWGGIDSVTDADTGLPIDNWMITSESGFDYSKPYVVPEPTSVALLSVGFCACAWWGWARPQKRRVTA
jgi:hypothetical protein